MKEKLKRKNEKKGISLIVLVITIIVIVILAVAVILSIANNNPIENANKAVASNYDSVLLEAANLAYTDWYTEKSIKNTTVVVEEYVKNKLKNQGFSDDKLKDLIITENGVTLTTVEKVKSIAHASYGNTATDTLLTYQVAALDNFKYVECDINFTSDGTIVLLHGNTINSQARNSDGSELSETINIADITYEEALNYDFGIYKSEKFAGTQILTFDEFMEFCSTKKLKPYIEIYQNADAAKILEVIERYNMTNDSTIISFYPDELNKIKELNSKMRLGYLLEKNAVVSSGHINRCKNLMSGENEVFINKGYSSDLESAIAICKENNIPLELWSVNSIDSIIELDPYISGVTSDHFHANNILYYNKQNSGYEIVEKIDGSTLANKKALAATCNDAGKYLVGNSKRVAYDGFIPVEQGYQYKVEFTSTIDNVKVGIAYYPESYEKIIENKETLPKGFKDTNWQDSGYETALANRVYGEKYTLMRLQFQNNSGETVSGNFIESVTISRKRVQ